MLRFKQFINEALAINDVNTTPAKKPAIMFLGRYQPPHKIHFERIKNGHVTDVIIVRAGKEDANKNPFPVEIQKEIINAVCGSSVKVHESTSGFIGEIVTLLRNTGREPKVLICGTDRVATYQSQLDRYSDKFNLDMKVQEFERTEDQTSGSGVRKALKENNFEAFKEMMPTAVATEKWFNKLKEYV